MFNADETVLYYATCTYISIQEKTMHGYKILINTVTLSLGRNASGTYKLTLLSLQHSENPHALKHQQGNTSTRSRKKSWITVAVFEYWFIPEVEKFCKGSGIRFKLLYILDNTPSHPRFWIIFI
jgi:hypothetical protein